MFFKAAKWLISRYFGWRVARPFSCKMKCWVQLLDSHGASYKGSSADQVIVDEDANIVDLRDAIKLKTQDILSGTIAAQLTVYQSREDLDSNQPLNPRQSVNAEIEYLVVVPEDSRDSQIPGLQERIERLETTLNKLTIKVLIQLDPISKNRPRPKRAMSLRKKVLKKVAQAAE